jgi:hypothetical protein
MERPVFGDKDWISRSKGAVGRRKNKPWAEIRGYGPEGVTCKTCKFLDRNQKSRTYYKCGKVEITNGPGTDIRLKDPACRLYEERGY